MKLRTMRDIPSISTACRRQKPGTREQAVNELAHLEHEKVRLERELSIWAGNAKRTQDRLQYVLDRLAVLQNILRPPAPQAASAPATASDGAAAGPASADAGADSPDGSKPAWREVSLEY